MKILVWCIPRSGRKFYRGFGLGFFLSSVNNQIELVVSQVRKRMLMKDTIYYYKPMKKTLITSTFAIKRKFNFATLGLLASPLVSRFIRTNSKSNLILTPELSPPLA